MDRYLHGNRKKTKGVMITSIIHIQALATLAARCGAAKRRADRNTEQDFYQRHGGLGARAIYRLMNALW
ncbi:hypothetical protein [Aestuariicoccus sp. MJ-SS9]|uniref:hypothetical protein n=1 Tax=Aestuariicoccus sp. MJ-SS9 TaxID=3079855 RepID=UPI002913C0F1|nr:hypothetical protein [Aestuariicoccus sp. MJ-SS9]MDU8914096.1 hypothetical protein [Aestuariicoccus sp. MJ-SS9]